MKNYLPHRLISPKETCLNNAPLEKQLLAFSKQGNVEGIQRILDRSASELNINCTDEKGRTSLFIAISSGYVVQKPNLISLLLKNGGKIKNGNILQTDHTPKLLTQYANAKNIQNILNRYHDGYGIALRENLVLEIGAGDGYLKYLLSLIDDPVVQNIKNRIVETELSREIVQDNERLNKHTIHKGIHELEAFFGKSFTPCIISMNVMDTFSADELSKNLQVVHNLLKPNGIFIHIMTSSIHPQIFADIRNRYPRHCHLPHHENGFLGVRLVPWNDRIIENFRKVYEIPENLCNLFANDPDRYIEMADFIHGLGQHPGFAGEPVTFLQYFIEKIHHSFSETGLQLVSQGCVNTEVSVTRNVHHHQFPHADCFENILGVLTPRVQDPDASLKSNKVVEKSTLFYLMGQKRQS